MQELKPLTNFGFKVVDRNRDEVEPILRCALEQRVPFEVGLYFADPATHEMLNAELKDSALALNTHLDHHHLSVFEIRGQEAYLRRQIETSLQWGAHYAIVHIAKVVMSPRRSNRKALMERLLSNFRMLNRICREYDFPLYLENTYHDLPFYQRIFTAVLHSGFDYIHACFDLGHAKVWSSEPLWDWLAFLDDLCADGFKLHFHLHANRGLADEHLSFQEAERLGATAADHFTAPWDGFEALSVIDQRFPDARKVFEIPPHQALSNLERVNESISRLRTHEATDD
jgi:hypothetical protein